MPAKGKALEKPFSNATHVAESRKQAQLFEAAANAKPKDEFEMELCCIVRAAQLPEGRKGEGVRQLARMCAKLRAGENPLSGLSPPPPAHELGN